MTKKANDNPLKIILVGASGRMGQEIIKLAAAAPTLKIVGSLDEKSSWNAVSDKKPDVVIDFSSPAGCLEAAEWCAKKKTPLVSGTTGLSPQDLAALKKLSQKTAVLWSPNMSLGVNILSEVLAQFARKFSDAEVEIEEIHHVHKKDKPSGTAKLLKESIEKSGGQNLRVREPVSLRGGEIFGIHKVFFFGPGESITFEHHAGDRSIFARGALAAAQWLKNQKPGLYSMKDFLKG